MNENQFTLQQHSDGHQPFDAPKDYFDAFPSRMSYRIQAGTKTSKRFDFEFIFRPVAITTVLVFVIGTAILTFHSQETDSLQPIDSEETLLSYVEQEGILDELSEEELIEQFSTQTSELNEIQEDSLSLEISEELVNEDFIDFESYYEL